MEMLCMQFGCVVDIMCMCSWLHLGVKNSRSWQKVRIII